MEITLTNSDIRFFLVWLANIKRRPHYEIIVVRQVISAFHNNTEHKLKNEVLALADLSRRAGENQ
ncbi:hypothetical protein LF296_12810 [Acinetobacter vivianii]|uniref:Uncharacterized protein n=1 Tax=Acinetobacter vivianii TaxID=1776742 RepID=A0AAJ6NH08_9GAMM|nr:hypothetical protein [Acinetobacter vivianii]WDZ50201.1 hypothetical protein LF296_12810 [Acinetobacter vivianii]